MKEVQKPLRTAYIAALSSIVIDTVTIPVYDEFAPADAPANYIIVTNQTDGQVSNKQSFVSDCSITVDINTHFAPFAGGKELSERIAEAVLQIIIPSSRVQLTVTGFQVVTTKKEQTLTFNENLPTIWVFRKVIIFTHKITEI
jgi:flagellar biosynthesis protein FliQ